MDDYELMFELSHPGRLDALRKLSQEPHRLTDLSKVLDFTSAEISRHLSRLSKAHLITKDGDGRYSLTPFGSIILHEVSNLGFLTKHNQYFSTHDLSVIPDELFGLSSISRCEFVEGTLEIMSMVEDLSRNAKSHIRVISDQPMRAMVDINIQKAEEGVDIKLIYPKNLELPKEYVKKKRLPIEIGLLDEVHLSMKLNEKSAGVALPDLDGKIDYKTSMIGKDPHFHKWAELLFNYYWDMTD